MTKYKTVFDIYNYIEACKFLQEKYDKLGFIRKDYFHYTKEGKLTKINGIGHGNVGLQYHHIREDIVPSLSDIERASTNLIEYQKAENMCYCNLLEHAWLHILITMNNNIVSDEDQDDLTGIGGVKWMLLALNSIFTNVDTSWYSSKNDEDKGCNYNYNNIITDNKKIYLELINRFCTSAFIRQRLCKEPEEILSDILSLQCKKDSGFGKLYNEIYKAATNTKLFAWNVNAYADLENYLRDYRTALIQICTGGGKTTTALEYLRVHKAKAIILGPNNTIGEGWKDIDDFNYIYYNYQTFMNIYKTINYNSYDVIICDEVHHTDAPRWGEGLQYVLDNAKHIKIIGLTATPNEKQLNGADKYFGGRICNGLDLAEGIEQGIIYPFSYIQSIYKMEDVKEDFESYGATGTVLWNSLNLQTNKFKAENILKKHMPEGIRKIICFVDNKKSIKEAYDIMQAYSSKLEIRVIYSGMTQEEISQNRKWFNDTDDKSICLITIGMVNEGAHYKGINTLVMFRKTNSATLYLQQLGRIICLTKYDDPKGIVFDFTNNAQNIMYNYNQGNIKITENSSKDDTREKIQNIQRVIKKLSGKEIIYKDYTENCAEVLYNLNIAKDTTNKASRILKTLNEQLININLQLEDILDLNLWKNLKIKSNQKAKLDKNNNSIKHSSSKNSKEALEEAIGKTTNVKDVKVDDKDKITTAFILALRRLYNFNIIDFDLNSRNYDLIINSKNEFNEMWNSYGFTNIEALEKTIRELKSFNIVLVSHLK